MTASVIVTVTKVGHLHGRVSVLCCLLITKAIIIINIKSAEINSKLKSQE